MPNFFLHFGGGWKEREKTFIKVVVISFGTTTNIATIQCETAVIFRFRFRQSSVRSLSFYTTIPVNILTNTYSHPHIQKTRRIRMMVICISVRILRYFGYSFFFLGEIGDLCACIGGMVFPLEYNNSIGIQNKHVV